MDVTLVVPAAGRGTRLMPDTRDVPKGLILLDGRPVLEYVFDAGLKAPISRIVLVVAPESRLIREAFGTRYRGIEVEYVVQVEPLGLAHAVSLAAPHVVDSMMVINGDEIFLESRHAEICGFMARTGAQAVVGVIKTTEPERICRGYGLDMASDGRIIRLVEKPPEAWNDILGVGTWLVTTKYFDAFERTAPHPTRRERDFVAVLQRMIDDGSPVVGFDLEGDFININTRDDLRRASDAIKARRVSLGA